MNSQPQKRQFKVTPLSISEQNTFPNPVIVPFSRPERPIQTTPIPLSTHENSVITPFPAVLPSDRSTIKTSDPFAEEADPPEAPPLDELALSEVAQSTKTGPLTTTRIIAIALVIVLVIAIYFIWRPATPQARSLINTQGAHQVTPGSSTAKTESAQSSQDAISGTIQAYIVGAVQNPGVYSLPADARIHHLLKAAGGPLPEANLVALNLAAKVQDGQEIYVTLKGEKPPTYVGGVPGASQTPQNAQSTTSTDQLININTASEEDMREHLHVSSKTAQAIIGYREDHGTFTSIEELLQVVSKDIYNKIKASVTI